MEQNERGLCAQATVADDQSTNAFDARGQNTISEVKVAVGKLPKKDRYNTLAVALLQIERALNHAVNLKSNVKSCRACLHVSPPLPKLTSKSIFPNFTGARVLSQDP